MKAKLSELMRERVLIFDGAMGTMLFDLLGNFDYPPELVNLERPDIPYEIHRLYIEAGANIITTNTFGGSRLKLRSFGLEDKFEALNRLGVEIAKRAAQDRVFVAGDIGPLGTFLEPFGNLKPREAFAYFYEQARVLAEAGVDIILVETMTDLLELKIAVMAAREATNLPIIATASFHEGTQTVTGSNPANVAVTLSPFRVFALGANCGGNPEYFPSIISEMASLTDIPLIAQPNAGVPRFERGRALYPLKPSELSEICERIYLAGASIIGSCCGSTPEHTKEIAKNLKWKKPVPREKKVGVHISSRTKTLIIVPDSKLFVFGERINPSGKKTFQEELRSGSVERVLQLAISQSKANCDAIDLNLSAPGVEENMLFERATKEIAKAVDLPIIFDSTEACALEAGFWYYPGRPVLNSVTAKEKEIASLLELARKFGSAFIALPIDDSGVPKSAEERIKLIKRIIDIALEMGFSKEDILADPIVLPVATELWGVRVTLATIREIVGKLGIPAVCGISNISFGLPARGAMNSAFLALCAENGLTCAFVNPEDPHIQATILALNLLKGYDRDCKEYINRLGESGPKVEEPFRAAILSGDKGRIRELVVSALKSETPIEIIERHLIPAIRFAGKLYEERKLYLSQLISASETMEVAMEILQPFFGAGVPEKGTILLATVEGDMHDIGKNLVGMVLKSYGYRVVDMGKNVSREKIIERCKCGDVVAVGLSSLMTTTIPSLRETIRALKKEFPSMPVVVGGATLSEELAKELGADAYAPDAASAPEAFERVISKGVEKRI